jgi:hypothetical protein
VLGYESWAIEMEVHGFPILSGYRNQQNEYRHDSCQ